jgi:ATP-binding protein involved in chromosome partitioning
MEITKDKILHALSHVEDPDLKKDLVTLEMIQDIKIDGNKVGFSLVLTTPACPLKDMLRNACINAIHHFIDKNIEVDVHLTSKVTTQKGSNEKVLKGIKNIIGVASGKGGVGKTTIAVNLALSLAKAGASVGLLDADIHGPSVPVMMGVMGIKPVIREEGEKVTIMPVEKYGIKVLSMGMLVDEKQPLLWRGPMVSNALRQMFLDVEWGELDYLVVDLPPGTGDVHLTFSQNFPVSGIVIVTTPQLVSVTDTRKTMEMFMHSAINAPILGVIENMSWFSPLEMPENKYKLFGEGGGKALSDEYNLPLLAQVPLFQGVAENADAGEPALMNQNPLVQRPFLEMAAKVAQTISIVNAKSPEGVAGAVKR